jgi:hypothetical protein
MSDTGLVQNLAQRQRDEAQTGEESLPSRLRQHIQYVVLLWVGIPAIASGPTQTMGELTSYLPRMHKYPTGQTGVPLTLIQGRVCRLRALANGKCGRHAGE